MPVSSDIYQQYASSWTPWAYAGDSPGQFAMAEANRPGSITQEGSSRMRPMTQDEFNIAYGAIQNPSVKAGQVSYNEDPERSDMRNWLSHRKAQRMQETANNDAKTLQAKLALRNQHRYQNSVDGSAYIARGKMVGGEVTMGPGAQRFQRRHEARIADLKARLPALKAKYGIGEKTSG
jgi:hypothetical protein